MHTAECLAKMHERRQVRELWMHDWPNHCRTCNGDGFLCEEDCNHPHGLDMPYDCPDWFSAGLCARCGTEQPELDNMLVCAGCGWEFDELGAPWLMYCTCGAAVPADAVGLLDTPMGVLLEVA